MSSKHSHAHPAEKSSHMAHQIRTGHDHSHSVASPQAASDFLTRFIVVTLLLIPLIIFTDSLLRFIVSTIIFYFSLVFFQHAYHEIKYGSIGMMTLVSMGVGAGYLFSATSTFIPTLGAEFYIEISTLVWILLFGHYLEARSSSAAGDALQEVAKLLPHLAHLKTASGIKDIDVSQLKKGDTVLVKPGEKVPADGKIVHGEGSFDESHITGESQPVSKQLGDKVAAGSISLDSSLQVKLTRIGESSTIGQIQALISQAQSTKPSVQKLADRAAKWLTISALAVSLLSLAVWTLVIGQTFVFAITLAITVLVIACPHALGLAIPTVSTIATRLFASNGIFIRDMSKIETVKNADYVAFDKTGTLTSGRFGVADIVSFSLPGSRLLSIAAAIEFHSSHVIGQSIVKHAQKQNLDLPSVTQVKNFPGQGISAQINHQTYMVGSRFFIENQGINFDKKINIPSQTTVFVADSKQVIGFITLNDQIKAESFSAIKQLHRMDLKVAMLTGDSKAVAGSVAGQMGIETVFAQVLPQDKYKYIKGLQAKGFTVIMVGDGINDAPALTQADVGVAIGAGTDIAVETGDIILTQSNPLHLVSLILLSRQVYRKMLQNLFWAVGYNILALPAAAGLFIPLGFQLTPAIGALLMSLSSVIVVLNALSLRRFRLPVFAD